MGLFQQALATYENNLDLVGKYEGDKEPLAPVGHIVTNANLEVTIDKNGHFISVAERDKSLEKVIIPVTEKSASRTSGIAAHPLCDKVEYLIVMGGVANEKHQAFCEQLDAWRNSEWTDLKVEAVYQYISRQTLIPDLIKSGIAKIDKEGNVNKTCLDMLVIWRVLGAGDEPCVWKDIGLMKKYSCFAESIIESKKEYCMLTGNYTKPANQHMKGVFSYKGNAKLISSNDTSNFTYRGRFCTADEAMTVSYEASQKAHNALKWLITNQSVIIGNRSFLCWSPEGVKVPSMVKSVLDFFGIPEETSTEPSNYQKQLSDALWGYKIETKNLPASKVVIVEFDAATSGRLAITAYREMATMDYFEHLVKWDQSCCWYFDLKEAIRAPSIESIVEFAYGNEQDRTGKGKIRIAEKVLKAQCDRLAHCRMGETFFPVDIVQSLEQRASSLIRYGRNTRRTLLSIACAVIRKYHIDHGGEEISMELDQMRYDRSYQFGRLLAVYEKIERDTYEQGTMREPSAIRLQSVYSRQPLHYAGELDRQMERAYFPRLKSNGIKIFYKNLIAQILERIYESPKEEWNKPLGDTYLMGYYLQRKNLYSAKKNGEEVEG